MASPSVALLRTQTDDRLVALAAAGHERAFEAIVERYRRQLLRHARRHLPEARAEDALQQALVSAWTALRRGDEVRELRPWLHRIVHNSALNTLRAPGYDYDELRTTLEGSGGPAELAERRAVVRGTLAGLAALPERQREALLRIAVEGRSQDEVAEQLGLSQGAVRQLVHRARTALRTAATAVVPLPLASWLATAGADRGDIAARVGELVAGAGGSATLAKAGAVAAIAGGAVAGPVVVHDVAERGQRPQAEAAASERGPARDEPASRDVAKAPSTPDSPAVAVVPARHDASGAGGGPDSRDQERSGSRSDDSGRNRGGNDHGSRERGDDGSGTRGGGDSGGRGGADRENGRRGEDDESGSHGGDDDHESSRRDGDHRSSSGRGGEHESSREGGDDDDESGSGPRSGSGGGDSSGSGDDDDASVVGSGEADGGGSSGPGGGDDDDSSGSSGSGGGPDPSSLGGGAAPVPSPSVTPSATAQPNGDDHDDD
jgi:RNA polymerase sigma factor (sigma-70 family)